MFKKGDKVRCINTTGYGSITKDRVYEVIKCSSTIVWVCNDIDDIFGYLKDLFELVNESNTFEFQVGDIVEFGGLEGKVDSIKESMIYPIQVTFENGSLVHFLTDGRLLTSHTKPLLNLVSRPKKKEKRVIKTTVQYSPSLNEVFTGFEEKQPDDLIAVTLEKEIEVEV